MRFELDHIGIAVESIPKMVQSLSGFGIVRKLGDVVHDPFQKTALQKLNLNGVEVELVSGSGVKHLTDRGVYHLCFRCGGDVDEAAERLAKYGWVCIKPLTEAKLFNGRRVAFFMRDGVIMEVVE